LSFRGWPRRKIGYSLYPSNIRRRDSWRLLGRLGWLLG